MIMIKEGNVAKRHCILAVDDEKRILTFLTSKIKASGYTVITGANGREAVEQCRAQNPDLVILDIMMPVMDGVEALKEIRSFSMVPVIMLSAKGADMDKVRGLTLGADDYLAKPFNPDELMARVEAILRRVTADSVDPQRGPIVIGDMTIDLAKCKVMVGETETSLTRIEWLLLSKLAQNAGRLLTYEELLSSIWGPEYLNDVQILRTWISRLRGKIEKDSSHPRLISTVPKVGYMLEIPKV